MSASAPHRVAAVLAGVLVFAGSYLVFPVESDAGYVINDALWNASGPELTPWQDISAHHPLFHIAANLLTPALDACGVGQPGHHAAKTLSALSGALIIALLALAGGAQRWWAGLLVGAPILATRAFWIEAGTGENVLLGVVGAVLATAVALDPNARPRRVGAVVVFALLCRQDNILLVPAWTYALWQRQETPRLRTTSVWLATTGGASLLAFVLLWAAFGRDLGFFEYLTFTSSRLAPFEGGTWSTSPGVFDLDTMTIHAGALTVLVTGLRTYDQTFNICVGLGFLALLIIIGLLLRGTRPARPLLVTTVLTLAVRTPFYLWFEPANFEWWLVPVGIIAWTATALAASPDPRRAARPAIAAVCSLAMIVGTVWAHAPHTWTLRQHRMARLMDRVVEIGSRAERITWVPLSPLPRSGLAIRGLRSDSRALNLEIPDAVQLVNEIAESRPDHTIVAVHDRFVKHGMAVSQDVVERGARTLDRFVAAPGTRYLRRRGRVQAVIIPPKR